jgi:hypothetical protein
MNTPSPTMIEEERFRELIWSITGCSDGLAERAGLIAQIALAALSLQPANCGCPTVHKRIAHQKPCPRAGQLTPAKPVADDRVEP